MTESQITAIIRRNVDAVQAEIRAACERSNRNPADVRLVAVSKYAEWDWVRALAEIHPVFGENRPQQLAERAAKMPDAEWHLIGQLQRNKVKIAVQHASTIHSVDSRKLLRKVTEVAADEKVMPQVLLQVNVTGESSKAGFQPDELRSSWESLITETAGRVRITGLMTMAPASVDPEECRPAFRGLAALRNELAATSSAQNHGVKLNQLSMGMSGDFSVAIEEGATMVRIGSRLYDGLQPDDH